ncbi:uncharacterized protein TNCV_541801 [Trichonephila clavipes]|nr:uncharacterized protein TNCV_541801 [Trichonephila clavipes]
MQMIRNSAQIYITHACGATSKRYLRLGDFDDFKFGKCVFFKKRSIMSRRKQRSAFDQVSQFDRGRIVAYRDCGLSFRCSLLGLPLTQNHRRLRRQWCDERRMWVAEGNEVVFTDESRICLQHHDGRIRVWRHREERMLNSCFMHHNTGPAPGIIVWGGIGYHSRTPLVRLAGTLNSLLLRGVGASCLSLPSGLGHSHISTG